MFQQQAAMHFLPCFELRQWQVPDDCRAQITIVCWHSLDNQTSWIILTLCCIQQQAVLRSRVAQSTVAAL